MKVFLYIISIILFTSCKWENEVRPAGDPYDLDYPIYFGDDINTPNDNSTTIQGVELGRHLFYEKALSQDKTISCASCHDQKLNFTDGLAFSVGVGGTVSRSSMSITNSLWGKSFFWDGRAATLEEQALGPIQNPIEMNLSLTEAVSRLKEIEKYPNMFLKAFGTSEITSDGIAKAMSQFERTLISANSKYDQYLNGVYVLDTSEQRGMNLFFTHPESNIGLRGGNCGDCHGGQQTFQGGFHNNGLDATFTDVGREMVTGLSSDRGKFKAPSLRNIALTAPYMHDGRFTTLEEVLDHYNEHIQQSATLDPLIDGVSNDGGDSLNLTTQEKQEIIIFLHLLTDSTFICNPEFSDPN